jgi:hypothetical protein
VNDKNYKACTCAACLHVLAGQVKFCPFCGVAQSQAASAATTPAKPADDPGAPVPSPPAAPKKSPPAPAPAPPAIDTAAAAKQEAVAKKAAEQKAAEQKAAEVKAAEQSTAALEAVAEAAPKKVKGKKSFETGATAGASYGGEEKKPMRLLTKLFLLGMAVLVVFWIKGTMLNHDAQRAAQEGLERQTTAAMTLAEACKLDEARAALQALDEAKGTPQQHATVQKAISDAASGCTKQSRHDAAWADAKVTAERALGNKNFDHANSTMKNFTAQWGEDDASRAMRDTINVQNANVLLDEAESCLKSGDLDCTTKKLAQAQTLDQGDAKPRIAGIQTELTAARERETATVPVVADAPAAAIQPIRVAPQVRATPLPASTAVPIVAPAASAPDPRLASLVNDAAKRMHEGNYRGAEDLMSMCVSLDPNNRRCQELRQRANQMNRTMLACVASGKDWANERCE